VSLSKLTISVEVYAGHHDMNTKRPNITEIFQAVTPIEQAVQEGAREAVLFHKKMGNPVATWKDGKVVMIPPEQIVVPDAVDSKEPNAA
jgi:hypothetical protein